MIEHRQRAFGHAEISAVQLQFAAADQHVDAWERHQIMQAALDAGLFEPGQELADRLLRALIDALRGGLEHLHPFADEVARRQRLRLIDKGADAAALRMAEHHDVLHPQHLHRIFQRR